MWRIVVEQALERDRGRLPREVRLSRTGQIGDPCSLRKPPKPWQGDGLHSGADGQNRYVPYMSARDHPEALVFDDDCFIHLASPHRDLRARANPPA